MSDAAFPRCCAACWHAPERPCPDLVACLTGGPRCHVSEACAATIAARNRARRREAPARPVIFVGTGTCGLGAGAGKTLAAVRAWLAAATTGADLIEVGCIGLCVEEPLVDIQLPGRPRLSFARVTEKRVVPLLDAVFSQSALPAEPLGQFRQEGAEPWPGVRPLDEHPFFAPQTRRVLANCGIVDPSSLEEYLARGGYGALAKALRTMTPSDIGREVELSGLRGRGGGGFPTGKKWTVAHNQAADQKYMICNADEGDPGAFMDRAVMEGDPHRVLEGLALAAYAIGASKAYIYTRAEYPLAIARVTSAIARATAYGLLGPNICDSGFSLDIVVKQGAGAFVCGEETALIHSIEGRRGMPRPRPPYPAVSGLFGKPTVINNVETLANVPGIVMQGAAWFASAGTSSSKGTKVFALSGNVARTGLVEVAMGTTLRQIVFDIGGGIPGGRAYKAVQIGGPSGGCIPASQLDIDIDYESLKTAGAMMGSGGLVVMDDGNCMVDVAKYFMDFIQKESCGKCIPCREGTRRMLEILESLSRRPSTVLGAVVSPSNDRRIEQPFEALERFRAVMNLEHLAKVIQDTSLCGLGQSAPNPVLSTLRWFRDEYEAHVYDRRCDAKACRELLVYEIDATLCKGCGICIKQCPSDAIVGTPKSPHHIIPERCVACGSCVDACNLDAVLVH